MITAELIINFIIFTTIDYIIALWWIHIYLMNDEYTYNDPQRELGPMQVVKSSFCRFKK